MKTTTDERRKRIELEALRTCGAYMFLLEVIEKPNQWDDFTGAVLALRDRLDELLEALDVSWQGWPPVARPTTDPRQTTIPGTQQTAANDVVEGAFIAHRPVRIECPIHGSRELRPGERAETCRLCATEQLPP